MELRVYMLQPAGLLANSLLLTAEAIGKPIFVKHPAQSPPILTAAQTGVGLVSESNCREAVLNKERHMHLSFLLNPDAIQNILHN